MKKVIALLFLASATLIASAQTPRYAPQSLTVPTVSGGGTSNSIAQVIDCRKQQNVTLSWTTGCTNVTVRLSNSVDGVNYQTNYLVWAFTNALPTTTYCVTTNIPTSGFGYLQLDSVATVGGIAATNTVSYAIKSNAP